MLQIIWLGRVGYERAWELQRALADARRSGEIEDVILVLEHSPVYTMGRHGDMGHIPGGINHLQALGAEYVSVDRGGSVTFHGPGQMVAYPIVQLREYFPLPDSSIGDVIAFVRALEEAIILTVAGFGVVAGRRPPHTGVWMGDQKLAAIGVKVSGGITTHGVAVNVSTDLDWFSHVIPCGIADAGVTSLAQLGAGEHEVEAVGRTFCEKLAQILGTTAGSPGARTLDIVASHLSATTV